MRYKHPKAEMHANGVYGGVGSRPAHEPWTPGGQDEVESKRPVPGKWRRLRLRRTRARRMTSDDGSDWPAIYVMLLIAVPLLLFFSATFLFHFGVL